MHMMGTAKMGADRTSSVTDDSGFVHDVDRLLVADASVFPTPVRVNPMETIMALSTRAAGARDRESPEVPVMNAAAALAIPAASSVRALPAPFPSREVLALERSTPRALELAFLRGGPARARGSRRLAVPRHQPTRVGGGGGHQEVHQGLRVEGGRAVRLQLPRRAERARRPLAAPRPDDGAAQRFGFYRVARSIPRAATTSTCMRSCSTTAPAETRCGIPWPACATCRAAVRDIFLGQGLLRVRSAARPDELLHPGAAPARELGPSCSCSPLHSAERDRAYCRHARAGTQSADPTTATSR